ncbi:PadR family transcriptional regulator [Candidatus Latescibacterota bacterium]
MAELDTAKYLPLTEATYYILLALVEPLHGYAVMQKVDAISEGSVSIGAGTLYGAFTNLQNEGLIRLLKQEGRRKPYGLTEKGRRVLAEQIKRLEIMSRNGKAMLQTLEETRRSP